LFYCLSWGSKHRERSFDGVPYSSRKVLVPIKELQFLEIVSKCLPISLCRLSLAFLLRNRSVISHEVSVAEVNDESKLRCALKVILPMVDSMSWTRFRWDNRAPLRSSVRSIPRGNKSTTSPTLICESGRVQPTP
jgi:hypothetical protein